MKNSKNFVQAVEAKLKGEDASTVAKKIQKQADSAFKAHIASLTGDTIALEDAVESAQEALDNARINNAQTISNRNQYVQNLVAAKNNLTAAEKALKDHKDTIAFLEEQHEYIK